MISELWPCKDHSSSSVDIIRPVIVHGFLAGDGSLALFLPVGIRRHAGCFSEYFVESLGGLVAA